MNLKSFFQNYEIRRLKRRIERDSRHLEQLTDVGSAARRLAERTADRRRFSHKTYVGFLYDELRLSRAFGLFEVIRDLFRRFRFLSVAFRVASYVIMLVEAGTLIIASTAATLVILPFLLLATLYSLLQAIFCNRRAVRIISEALTSGAPPTVIFISSEASKKSNTLAATARDLAASGRIVICVTPYTLSRKGIFGRGVPFMSIRSEGDGIFTVRRHTYFSARKLLCRPDAVMIHI